MLPLTKEQKKFLKDFDKKAKKYKKNNEGETERRVIDINGLIELLNKHRNLNPCDPMLFKKDDEELYPFEKKELINLFFEKQKMNDMIQEIDNYYFGITSEGYKAIKDYSHEKIKAIRLPLIAIIVSIASIVPSIIALVLSIIKK